MKIFKRLVLMVICLQSAITFATEKVQVQPGVVLRDTPVFQAPDRHSTLLYEIEEDTNVYIKQRQKSWYEVDSESQETGWLRLLSVRYLGDPKKSFLGEISDFSSKVFNVQRSGPVVTTGARGLDEEEFIKAEPDFVTLDIILAKKTHKNKVLAFAKQQNITIKEVVIPDSYSAKKEKKND
ncbi:MAG: hypothetical protein COA74_06065 [Gammaproteobacteria bacterium]|nr:MAG: hypothetical protein COA74_06065 [Gammaproteobacteria bacterium]